jgi:TRIAD3 protein (E3 ubiquitin-protein ligase RNF216)
MIRILDFEDHKDISRLCLLLKLDLSKNNLIDTLSELHSYNLRQPLSAIRCTNDLKELFPNADPIYLDIVGEVFSNNITGLNEFLDKVATNIISYPRITGYNEKLKTLKIIQSLTVNFNVKDFLKLCPDPVNYFKNLNRNIKKNHYIEESMSYLSYK